MSTKKSKKTKKESKVVATATARKSTVDYSRYLFLGLLLIGLAYIVTVQSTYVDFGLDRDEGTYINLGEVLRDGGKMYQDAYSIKPPAIFYSYAIFNTIFGYTGSGLRWSLIVANAIGALLLFLFGYRWKGPFFGFVAGLSYLFFSFNPFVFGFAALAEHYQNVLAIMAVVAMQHGVIKRKWIWIGVAGALLTYAVLFKQNLIFGYAALAAGLGWYYVIDAKTRAWSPIFYFIAGSAIMTVLVFLPLIIQGGWSDWIYWNFTYSSLYTSAIPWEKGQEYLASFFKFTTKFNYWMWIVGAIGIVVSAIKTKSTAGKITVVLFFLASIASIFPGLRFYPHYWIYLSPILAIGCAWSFYMIIDLLKNKITFTGSAALSTVIFIAGLAYVVQTNKEFFNSPNELYINRRMYGDNPFTETRILGDYLKKQIKPEDEVLVLGSEPQFQTYLGKSTPTPYIFFAQLTKQHERQKDMVADLQNWAETQKPKYAYFSNHPYSWVMSAGTDQSVYHWGSSFVQNNYKVIGVADLLPGQGPRIVLGAEAATYQVQSQKWVKIYERIYN